MSIDWSDPKWNLPNVHVAANGSFVPDAQKEES